ncbi:MAG: LuxR family transcriptional regulator [Anaerolineae bacterium]|nr:LuxR family transcriptional regulator [Anaerolineae bacterium]
MPPPILATKLYIPPPRPNVVLRPRLIKRLNEGLQRKLTLISAPAGFGKTTLVSEWVNQKAEGGTMKDEKSKTHPSSFIPHPSKVAWLSLDEGDNAPTRFLAYFVAALQTLAPRQSTVGNIGKGVLAALQTPQPPPTETILTALLNEIATIPDHFVLVLDDYHVIEAKPVDASTSVNDALTFLLEHLPPQMHLVIVTREDPQLPLARYRARDQLTELRAADLRFTSSEAAEFLNQVMSLNLSAEDIAALETRTEGWIAGLQLAAISMQGHQDAAGFIKSFTGSHHFVLDYLVEEVLEQQPASVQTFLLRTSILDRLCGPLCDAVCSAGTVSSSKGTAVLLAPSASGQETLEYLQQANLFIVPLDNERLWYRYHHLFADLLRQRLQQQLRQSAAAPPSSPPSLGESALSASAVHSSPQETEEGIVAELHRRASQWYEDNGLEIEAFHHATAANDVERAARLVEGKGMPLQFRGAVVPVLNWLASLPAAVLDARPSLWVMYASALSMSGQTVGVEQKLQAAEAALAARQDTKPDDKTRNLIGHIAAIRALLAVSQYQVETIIAQSRRALEYLHPDNLAVRTATIWKLGIAYQLQGDRAAAGRAYTEAMSISQASGNGVIYIAAATGLGNVQESENRLYLAAETYRRILQLMDEPPLPGACEAHLGLARISYEWNDLDAAEQHGQRSVLLARQMENTDNFVACEVFLARLKLVRGDAVGAAAILTKASESARRHNFVYRLPEVVAAQVMVLLHQGEIAAAAQLAEEHKLPLSRARVHLAQGDPSAALAVLESLRRQVEAKGWADEQLKVMVLQAVAHHAYGEKDQAARLLADALALAEPGGFIRIFVDEGRPMMELLTRMKPYDVRAEGGRRKEYIDKLLAAFGKQKDVHPSSLIPQPLPEPLSQRELEVLQLIAQGLSNSEISERLFLALSTVKGHNRRIYGKLQVQRRTEAIARARELGLL